MKKINKTPLSVAMGAAFISTFVATGANAEANPFGMTKLSSGYMQVAAGDASTKTGEMPCGAAMGGMTKPKAAEGACAGMKKPGAAAKTTEGSKMKDESMKGKEGASGDTMKMPAVPAADPAK
jgi:uncharacterized low-complexity protein